MTKKGRLDEELFEGATINTPSLLAVEDYLDTLKWGESVGGLEALHARANANSKALYDWAARTPWIAPLAEDARTWSNTGVCLKIVDPRVTALSEEGQAEFAKKLAGLLEKEGVALDAASYRSAPPGPAHLVRRDGGARRCGSADPVGGVGVCGVRGRTRDKRPKPHV